MKLKTCHVCGEQKSTDCFYRDASRNDGTMKQCSECLRLRTGGKRFDGARRTKQSNRSRLSDKRAPVPERTKRFSERAYRQAKACYACGEKALYRIYNAAGENFGACKAHRDGLRQLGFGAGAAHSPAISAIIDKGL